MTNTSNQEIQLSKSEKIGIVISLVGLLLNVFTLGTFDFSLARVTSQETSSNTVLWVSMMTTLPLLYIWGFVAWLANSKYKKMINSILVTGIILFPFYAQWGAMVLSEGILSYYRNLPHFVHFRYLDLSNVTRSRIEGGLWVIPIQIIVGLVILIVLMLWKRLITPDQVIQEMPPKNTSSAKQQVIKPNKKKTSTTRVATQKRKS